MAVWVWKWAGAVALKRDAHLSDDEAVAKMGHPGFVRVRKPMSENPDMGHPHCACLAEAAGGL
jgi:hypothetical protein